MAEHDFTEHTIVNGFKPVSVTDIECMAHITYGQAEAMGALFHSIARLIDDKEVKALCAHGALQADMQANDIDVLRECAVKAGFDVSAPLPVQMIPRDLRREGGAITSTLADNLPTVSRTPFGWMHVNPTEEEDHASMRAKQLAGLLALMSGADGSGDMLRLAAKLSAEVAEAIRRMVFGPVRGRDFSEIALQARQIAQVLIALQPREGPSDMLWLAQQLVDELVDTVAGVSVAGDSA